MKELINLTYWRQGHPLPVESASDFYYVNLARHLYNTICATEMGRQSTKVWVAEAAMNVAYYLEDVVSGLGFWRVFVEKHKSLYGKYLPFYTINEGDYYTDEINLPDLYFLLWMLVQNNKREILVNPENPYLMDLASELYRQLDKEFEKAPINDGLLDNLKCPDMYQTFDKLALVGMKMMSNTYLFRPFTAMTERTAVHEVERLLVPGSQLSLREYTIRFIQVFCKNTGPLALKGTEWLSALLKCWGLTEESQRVEQLKIMPLAYYRLAASDEQQLTLETYDGEQFVMSRDIFQPVVEQLTTMNKVCLATLVHFGEKWVTAGVVSWYADASLFEQYKSMQTERHRVNEDVYHKVLEANGHPVVYFEDWSAFIEWAKQHLDVEEDFKPTREMTSGKCLALFADPTEGMTLVPNEARFICDPEHNPHYNAAQARRGSLALLITPGNVSTRMLHYLLDNNMLPDAALLSVKDVARGKCLVQENMDFIARFMRTIDY